MNFNVTKVLKKLDEYVKRHTIKEYPHCIVSTDILREMFLAGQEDEVNEKVLNSKETRVWIKEWVTEQIHNQNRRIGEIEAKIGTELLKPKVKAEFEKIEERLARLEASFNNFVQSCKYCEEDIEPDNEPEKPVTEQDCQDDHDQPHKLFKDDKPSEFISIPRDVAEEWFESEFITFPNRHKDKELIHEIHKALGK